MQLCRQERSPGEAFSSGCALLVWHGLADRATGRPRRAPGRCLPASETQKQSSNPQPHESRARRAEQPLVSQNRSPLPFPGAALTQRHPALPRPS
ncbi:hypothetical protein COCON_G00046330 [Conger conger]|uniref:Uncharacterized protein n=1 Tax=Conger conger TaxID=82655 RepID=A0A9Q1DV33_CONCO|nr:hypothetical protein COCON_G00046330 [Conger conger]